MVIHDMTQFGDADGPDTLGLSVSRLPVEVSPGERAKIYPCMPHSPLPVAWMISYGRVHFFLKVTHPQQAYDAAVDVYGFNPLKVNLVRLRSADAIDCTPTVDQVLIDFGMTVPCGHCSELLSADSLRFEQPIRAANKGLMFCNANCMADFIVKQAKELH